MSDELEQLAVYLGMYCKAPENAPDDWLHHGDENIEAWIAFIRKSHRQGFYVMPIDKDNGLAHNVHAKWVKGERDNLPKVIAKCSNCGTHQYMNSIYAHYCQRCGAVMDN